ncbi:unnamed protein product [Sphenostylis stenocarpa]|uniref:Ubiquitin fusion degradation protein UFD1 N-terminal subdomain 2 domain-containing protein n=1 Tax=Sphenostylis stenocarpa TaxID=92480 RepID=A0AA86VD39_9FABA|nr:unnamed protein product [Sphenostylis stenocarpa]
MIAYNNKQYYIDIVETKPFHGISIVDTDCEVDFVQPLDYEEPEKQLPADSFDKGHSEVHDSIMKNSKIIPFSGTGRRLDGKPTQSMEESSFSLPKQQQKEHETKNSISETSRRTPGKVVFGSSVNASKTQTTPKASQKSITEA